MEKPVENTVSAVSINQLKTLYLGLVFYGHPQGLKRTFSESLTHFECLDYLRHSLLVDSHLYLDRAHLKLLCCFVKIFVCFKILE